MKKLTLIAVLALLMMALIVPAASAAPPASDGYWYKVKHGDTLSGIAYYHGVRLSRLIHTNSIYNPDHIYYGQHLWIPTGGYGHGHHGHQGHYGNYHTVHYGETLSSIAYRYGVSMWAIAKANNLHNLNHIYAGQSLHIPSGY